MYEGIIESDDVAILSLEIEKSLNYCKKCNLLVESVKRKDTLVHSRASCILNFYNFFVVKQGTFVTEILSTASAAAGPVRRAGAPLWRIVQNCCLLSY